MPNENNCVYYVYDPFGNGVEKLISGPFMSKEEANDDLKEWNCADDYKVIKMTNKNGKISLTICD